MKKNMFYLSKITMEVKLTPTGRVSIAKTIGEYQATEREKYRTNEEYRERLKSRARERQRQRYLTDPDYKAKQRAYYYKRKAQKLEENAEQSSLLSIVGKSAIVGVVVGFFGSLVGWSPGIQRLMR